MKNIFRIILLSSLCLLLGKVAAQNTAQPIQHFYLKGGGHLRGHLLSSDNQQQIQIQLLTGETVSLQRSSLLQVNTNQKRQRIALKNGEGIPSKGFYYILQTGISMGYIDQRELALGANVFSMSFGHRFNPHWQVGGGFGLDFYDQQFIPIFAEGRWHPWQSYVSPFIGLQMGYSLGFDVTNDSWWQNNSSGGTVFHPSIGLRLASKRIGNFMVDAGYRFQRATRSWGGDVIDTITYRRLSLRLGWEF